MTLEPCCKDETRETCGCSECEYERVKVRERKCRICSAERYASGCTNGLCNACHRAVCTDGGATYPGHYIDRERQAARLVQIATQSAKEVAR